MRASTTILTLLLLVAGVPALADNTPDYSSQGLLRLFNGETLRPTGERALMFSYGVVTYHNPVANLTFSPALLPLSGSELRTTNVWPDPFSLTRTQIATSKRAWRTQRQYNAELRRIKKSERARIRVSTE